MTKSYTSIPPLQSQKNKTSILKLLTTKTSSAFECAKSMNPRGDFPNICWVPFAVELEKRRRVSQLEVQGQSSLTALFKIRSHRFEKKTLFEPNACGRSYLRLGASAAAAVVYCGENVC